MKKYILVAFLVIVAGYGALAHAADQTTTGFIPGQIWYSKEPLIEGETVKIYTAVWNGDDDPLSAKVEFYDKNVVLGTRDVIVPSQKVVDVSVSWKVTSGDHVITAKISSSSVTSGGKKEQVVLERSMTEEDRKFVPVSIKTVDGEPASSTEVIKSQVDKAGTVIADFLPESVATPVSNAIQTVDAFRDEKYTKISTVKNETQKEIDALNANTKSPSQDTPSKSITPKAGSSDGTQKPIAYVKLFLFAILGFIFGNSFVFYGLLAFLLFCGIRYIYRQARDR